MKPAHLTFLFCVAACHTKPAETSSSSPTKPAPTTLPTIGGADTQLASLTLGTTAFTPAFEVDRRYYALLASTLETPFEVQTTTVDPDATVAVTLETVDGVTLAAGHTLSTGPNQRIRIDVTSADGTHNQSYAVALLPDDFPRPYTEGTSTEGWNFLGAWSTEGEFDRYLMVVDDLGTPAWWRTGGGIDFRIAADGRFTWYGYTEEGGSQPQNLVLAPTGGEFDVSLDPGPVPDGWESNRVDEHEWYVLDDLTGVRIINGKVLEDLSAWGGVVDQKVENQKAQHIDLDGNILFEWSTQGLMSYDLLPPNLTERIAEADFEAFHINSIDIDPADGHWVLSFQRISAVAKIARHGPSQGEVLWMFGGPTSDFTFIDDVRPSGWTGFAGQHGVRVVGPNRIAMYDAGLGDSDNVGDVRFIEYQLDLDTMEAHVANVREWTGRGNGWAGGSVQEMPGGGQLVGFGSLRYGGDIDIVPVATELSAEGDEVWNLWIPGGQWSYRAWRVYGDPLSGEWSQTPQTTR